MKPEPKILNVLVADPSGPFRLRLLKMLAGIGMDPARVRQCGSGVEAKQDLQARRADLVLLDSGIRDATLAEIAASGAEPLIIVTSTDTSQAAVAKAVEDGADGYLLKPFTRETLAAVVEEVLDDRHAPSPYLLMVRDARARHQAGDADAAVRLLKSSFKLHPRPSLAESRIAEIHASRKEHAAALEHFQRALVMNKIHWPSLSGLLALYRELGRPDDLYETLRRVVRSFPFHAQRLNEALRLAVETENFDDIDEYARIFGAMDTARFEEQQVRAMLSHVSAAMVVAGKHFVLNQNVARAMPLFERSVAMAPDPAKFRDYVQATLREFGLNDELRRFGSSAPASAATPTAK